MFGTQSISKGCPSSHLPETTLFSHTGITSRETRLIVCVTLELSNQLGQGVNWKLVYLHGNYPAENRLKLTCPEQDDALEGTGQVLLSLYWKGWGTLCTYSN